MTAPSAWAVAKAMETGEQWKRTWLTGRIEFYPELIEAIALALDEARAEGAIGFDDFVKVCERFLERYPAAVVDGSSGDSGPLFVVALREALARLQKKP